MGYRWLHFWWSERTWWHLGWPCFFSWWDRSSFIFRWLIFNITILRYITVIIILKFEASPLSSIIFFEIASSMTRLIDSTTILVLLLNTLCARLFTMYLWKIPSLLFASNFSRFFLSLRMTHLLPNTWKYFTLGLFSFHISYDVYLVLVRKKIWFPMWHDLFMTSPQNFWGLSLLKSITLAISWITQFFISTTLFCWGVFESKNSFLIPFCLQMVSNFVFSNSFPWLLLILTMGTPFSFWSLYKVSPFFHMLLTFLYEIPPKSILRNYRQQPWCTSCHPNF